MEKGIERKEMGKEGAAASWSKERRKIGFKGGKLGFPVERE